MRELPDSSEHAKTIERRAGLAVVLGFALLMIYFTRPFPNPNDLSRLETVYACVEQGTFRIDGAMRVLGDQEDKAISGGHFYSNKAPGLALAAIPVYRLLRVFFPPPRSSSSAIFVLLRILVVSLVCTLALARFRSRLLREGALAASLVAAAAGFGTSYLFYARSFFSHAWTAALLFLAWDLLMQGETSSPRRGFDALAAAAGMLAGWAAISEYPAAIPAALLAGRAFAGRSLSRAAWFAAGVAVPLALLLWYDAACFGSPWILSSAREASPEYADLARRGLFGFEPPSAHIALAYFFHPARGVLLFAPFFLWSALGFWRWWRSREARSDCLFSLAATVLFLLAMCGYPNWHGGWSLGSRYLLPVLFFAAFAIPRALESPVSRWFFAAAAAFSIAAHALIVLTWPHFPLNVPWPPVTASLWFLERGWIAPNLFSSTGAFWLCLAMPLAATLAALLFSLRSARLPRNRGWATLFLGLAPLVLTVLTPPTLSFGGLLWRAGVFGKFSGRDPAREELREVIRGADTPAKRRHAREAWKFFGPV